MIFQFHVNTFSVYFLSKVILHIYSLTILFKLSNGCFCSIGFLFEKIRQYVLILLATL